VLLLRLAAIIAVIAVVVGAALYLFTGDRAYLRYSLVIFKWGIGLALLYLGALALERLAVIV